MRQSHGGSAFVRAVIALLAVDLRTPFALDAEGVRAELSSDGRRFTTVGAADDDQDVFSIPVRPARSARFACLRGAFSGSQLQELSVW